MIRELTIENFRAFRELNLTGLGRVNLLVGANNSGKTSVLEAVAFLASGGDPYELYKALARRGEEAFGDAHSRSEANGGVFDVRYLFHGRQIDDGAAFKLGAIDANNNALEISVSTPRIKGGGEVYRWRNATSQLARFRDARRDPLAAELDHPEKTSRFLEVKWPDGRASQVPLLLNGGLTRTNAAIVNSEPDKPVYFVPTAGISEDDLAGFYEKIVITAEEMNVVTALRQVESRIDRLATRQADPSRGRSVVAGMEGASEPVALGNLGNGMHRMLAIALFLVISPGGYVLIDDIDTGLHHTVIQKMWKLVFETAKRLDVTVFATTHSYDCVHALAAIARPDIRDGGEVSLIRVERDNPRGVHFTEAEISHLAEWQIEAR